MLKVLLIYHFNIKKLVSSLLWYRYNLIWYTAIGGGKILEFNKSLSGKKNLNLFSWLDQSKNLFLQKKCNEKCYSISTGLIVDQWMNMKHICLLVFSHHQNNLFRPDLIWINKQQRVILDYKCWCGRYP